jgi:hypothetical protein
MSTLSGEEQAIEKIGIQVIHSAMAIASRTLNQPQRPGRRKIFHPTHVNFKECSRISLRLSVGCFWVRLEEMLSTV